MPKKVEKGDGAMDAIERSIVRLTEAKAVLKENTGTDVLVVSACGDDKSGNTGVSVYASKDELISVVVSLLEDKENWDSWLKEIALRITLSRLQDK